MFKGILSIIFLITAVAIFFVWTSPFYDQIQELRTQEATFDDFLDNSKQVQELVNGLIEDHKKISQANLDKLNEIIPVQPNPISFILELEKIVQANGMVLKDVSVSSLSEQKTQGANLVENGVGLSGVLPVTIKVFGTYNSFYSFIGDLEKNLRLTEIKSLSFTAGDTGFYDFSMDVEVYYKNTENETQI